MIACCQVQNTIFQAVSKFFIQTAYLTSTTLMYKWEYSLISNATPSLERKQNFSILNI